MGYGSNLESFSGQDLYSYKEVNTEDYNNITNRFVNNKAIESAELLIKFFENIYQLNTIKFKRGSTDNMMDYVNTRYGFFNYQYDIITKLNEKFDHI